eukprot:6461101-Prymnesium_polylepis.1
MRWSRNEFIGFDQIDDIYVAAIQNASSDPESETDAGIEGECAERPTFCRATSVRLSSANSSVRGSRSEGDPDDTPSGHGSASKAVVIEYRSTDPRSSGKRVQLSMFAPRCVSCASQAFRPHYSLRTCFAAACEFVCFPALPAHPAPLCASIAVTSFVTSGALRCGPSCCI